MMNNIATESLLWPFDNALIMRKKKALKRELLSQECKWVDINVAILGGSTTNDIQDYMELFLLAEGIRPAFYSSEYGKYYEDGVFDNPELDSFNPQVVFIHTTSKNIQFWPNGNANPDEIGERLNIEYTHLEELWESIFSKYNCTIIQNNYDRPIFRLLGNQDVASMAGNSNYIYKLNGLLYNYAQEHNNFFIHDIDFLSANFGLSRWHDGQAWDLYKSAMALNAGPEFAYNVTRIIKALYGKNKKAIALDLDNTLWGGIIGEDGADSIELGNETATGEGFHSFQDYLLKLKNLGVILTVNSKNDEQNALSGLNHVDSTLRPDDFVSIKANWISKDQNMQELADEIEIGIDSFIFIDDNPAEREIVHSQHPDVVAPSFTNPSECIQAIDMGGYFESTGLTEDDKKRSDMYKANVSRKQQEKKFESYDAYLESLEMKATIRDFERAYISRISQLTNKTNQFNLTTKRFTEAEIEAIASDPNYIRLYARLEDKFGDNGLISVVFGQVRDDAIEIEEWLMSCRVLKRDVEKAMLDALVEECNKKGITTIIGFYFPTPKNHMVKDLYSNFGFSKISESEDGATVWKYNIANHKILNKVIKNIER